MNPSGKYWTVPLKLIWPVVETFEENREESICSSRTAPYLHKWVIIFSIVVSYHRNSPPPSPSFSPGAFLEFCFDLGFASLSGTLSAPFASGFSRRSAHVRLFNTQNSRLTLPRLREVYHLPSYAGTNKAGGMVQLSQARRCHSGVAGVE